MKFKIFTALFMALVVVAGATDRPLKGNFVIGNPGIKSINSLAFGPEGILFIGDSKMATIVALDTEDTQEVTEAPAYSLEEADVVIAEALGTTADKISIQDMVVNPISKRVYIAVHNEDGTPVLLTISSSGDKEMTSKIDWISLDKVSYSSRTIEGAVAEDAKDRRGRALRVWSISDLQYDNGYVMVTGLSNKEFGSTFRKMPFPFGDSQDDASLEIYHAAHGQFETNSPIKTFTTSMINGKPHLIASYTCTPLVVFPLDQLKGGEHVKGRTVAELGSGNSPLDMIIMEKDGNNYLIMSNSNRPVMKIKLESVAAFNGTLTTPIEEAAATEGVDYISLPLVNVTQLDKLDDTQFIMLKRGADGKLNLTTANNRWL